MSNIQEDCNSLCFRSHEVLNLSLIIQSKRSAGNVWEKIFLGTSLVQGDVSKIVLGLYACACLLFHKLTMCKNHLESL
jgi:hypothetical protein